MRIVGRKVESVIDGIAGDVIAYGKIVAGVSGTAGEVLVAGFPGILRDIVGNDETIRIRPIDV